MSGESIVSFFLWVSQAGYRWGTNGKGRGSAESRRKRSEGVCESFSVLTKCDCVGQGLGRETGKDFLRVSI